MNLESFLADLIGAEKPKEVTNLDKFREWVIELAKKHKVAFIMGVNDNEEFGVSAFPEIQELAVFCEIDTHKATYAHTEMLEKLAKFGSLRAYRVGLAAPVCDCGSDECVSTHKMKQWVPEELKTESPKQDATEPANEDAGCDGEPKREEKPIYDNDGKQIGDYEEDAKSDSQTVLPILRERTGLVSPKSIANTVLVYLEREPSKFQGICDVAFAIGLTFEQLTNWPMTELVKKKLVVREGRGKFARIRLATVEDYKEASVTE